MALSWFGLFRQPPIAPLLQNTQSLKGGMLDTVHVPLPQKFCPPFLHPALLPQRLASEDCIKGFLSSFGWAQLRGAPSWKWRRGAKRGPVFVSLLPPCLAAGCQGL